MALKHEQGATPHQPHEAVQHALRVLETVAHRGVGVTDTELARVTGLPADQLTILLRMLRRRVTSSRAPTGRTPPARP